MTSTQPSRLPPDEDETNGMPPPDAEEPWTFRPPSGIPPEANAYLAMLEERPSGEPPGYVPPRYAPPGRVSSDQAFHIYSVGRRAGRAQAAGYRRPFDFEHAHGIFFRVRFESLPIPSHALGVAYLNYDERKWFFGRRVGNYHVEYRSGSPPYDMQPPQRLSQFCAEALSRVGTTKYNKSRWYYFNWDRSRYGEGGDSLL